MDLIGQLFTGQPEKGNFDRVKSTEQVDNNVPGDACNRLNEYKPTFATMLQIQIHNKTIRTLAAIHSDLNPGIAEAIAITELYLQLHGLKKRSRDLVVDFSGARTAWKARVNKEIDQAIESGYIISEGKGTIYVSQKGKQLIEEYNRIYEEAANTYERQGYERRQRANKKSTRTRATPPKPIQYIERAED